MAAAGNGNLERPEKKMEWPAAMPEVISVGAYDSTLQGCLGILRWGYRPRRALFSYHEKVDALAPGVALQGTYVNGWPTPGRPAGILWRSVLERHVVRRAADCSGNRDTSA